MKIDFISDLHMEINKQPKVKWKSDGDVLLLLGDTTCLRYFPSKRTDPDSRSMRRRFQSYLNNEWSHYEHIFMIAGNHEYYGWDYNQQQDLFGVLDPRLKYGSGSHVIGDVNIICATLWTDYARGNPIAMLNASQAMNDYRIIFDGGVPITPERLYQENLKDLEFIKNNIEKSTSKHQIVATHHAPSLQSHNNDRYSNADIKFAYCNDYDEWIMRGDVDYWLHGHTHSNVDYEIGKTKIKSAMYGYDFHDPIPRPFEIGRIEL